MSQRLSPVAPILLVLAAPGSASAAPAWAQGPRRASDLASLAEKTATPTDAATLAPTESATPTATPTISLVLADDFSDPAGGWSVVY